MSTNDTAKKTTVAAGSAESNSASQPQGPQSTPFLIDARKAASLCGVSRSSWWSLHASGKTPQPVHLGRRTLWHAKEIEQWTTAGCPSRDRWNNVKGGRK